MAMVDRCVEQKGADGPEDVAARLSDSWIWSLASWAALAFIAIVLVMNHSVMAYSDPHHWLFRAAKLAQGEPLARRVLLFPLYLVAAWKAVGPDWVYLANLPWVLLLVLQNGLFMAAVTHGGAGRAQRALAMVLGMLLLTICTHSTLIRCLNPYREAGAFALLMGGTLLFLASDRGGRWFLGGLAGLCLTLSMGFRETTALSFLPLTGWTFVRLLRAPRRRLAWCAALLAGGIVGLSPFFVQNYLYSGHALIPGYSAHLVVERQQDEASQDEPQVHVEKRLQGGETSKLHLSLSRLVPGMKVENFRGNAPRAWEKLKGRVGHVGLILAGLGVLASIVRRQWTMLGLIVPSLALNYSFYCFYFYVKWRYFFIADIYVSLLAAYGVVSVCDGVTSGMRRLRLKGATHAPPVWVAITMVTLLAWSLRVVLDRPPALKVWEMSAFRAQVKPLLEEPWEMMGYYHHREMLSWILGEGGFQHTPFGSEISRKTVSEKGLDATLHDMGTQTLERLEHEHFYFHDLHHTPRMLPLWCEFERIVDMREVQPQVYHYGRAFHAPLYRVRPWRNPSTRLDLKLPIAGSPTVLLLDPMRPWDYPERRTFSLWANDALWLERVENGARFYELPERLCAGPGLALEFKSDLPTPPAPGVKLWAMNSEMDLAYGFRPVWRFHHLASSNLYADSPLREDCWMLWDEGSLQLPVFADEDHEMHAELTLEYYQEDPGARNQPAFIEASTASGDREWQLPGARRMAGITFPLGPGCGTLDWRTLDLHTSLPSYEEQLTYARANPGKIKDWSFIKLCSARVYAVPKHTQLPWKLTVGDRDAGAWLVSGFHLPDRHEGRHPVRWTSGHAVVRLPTMSVDDGAICTLRYLGGPAPVGSTIPEVRINGETCHRVNISSQDGSWTTASYAIPSALTSSLGGALVEIRSPSWSPNKLLGTPDSRELGAMLYQLEVSVP
jgi:hypothetical protein